ncbi:hypothetical protein RCO27_12470 [Sphingosinicella sp. LHD-64]|uniref:hypothetical protein n=1 Tax=Sphingosinicella sp. LHD-64 TaxID=3072139 RepID=UPI00280DF1B2|nr:hypothetical protein [Sphingosinicella sp. LHD-64]MDQ8757043.1 hypothetical protein [Sphingosinicella sp. LHD-64]
MREPGAAVPKRRWRVWHFVTLGAIVLAAFVAILLTTVLSLTRPVVDDAETFMLALRDGNYETAYARMTPALQAELGSARQMEQRFARLRPTAWSWNSRRIVNGIGEVQGTATFAAGGSGRAGMQFEKIGDEWRVTWFRLDPP